MFTAANKHLRYMWWCVLYNVRSAMEYRTSFVIQVAGMIINDLTLIFFWWIFFTRVTTVNGYQFNDMVLLFAIPATGFGLAETFFGNHRHLPRLIAEGGLDGYLTLPRNVLISVITARTSIPAIGDCLFGAGAFCLTQELIPYRILFFLFASANAALIWVSFSVLVSSLAFLFGNMEIFAGQMSNALITFSIYPPKIFQGLVRVLLYTAIPAGFLCYMPVQLINAFDPVTFSAVVLFTAGIMVAAGLAFGYGLRKYESGNLVVLKL